MQESSVIYELERTSSEIKTTKKEGCGSQQHKSGLTLKIRTKTLKFFGTDTKGPQEQLPTNLLTFSLSFVLSYVEAPELEHPVCWS